MRPTDRTSLWTALNSSPRLSERFLWDFDTSIALADLASGSSLSGRADELCGRSVLVATTDQLTTALALIELDGRASRLVLYPPDLPIQHIPFVIRSAAVDAIVSDRADLEPVCSGLECLVTCRSQIVPAPHDRIPRGQTEWILLTSGTTGLPKIVVHTLSSMAAGIDRTGTLAGGFVWSTFYDIRRYGGLQIFLRALLTGGSLVLSNAREATADFLVRAGSRNVTHISGTPSHWRRALISTSARSISPKYVRLSGEIADQAILDNLRSVYPQATIAHAFASTEAGLAFDVRDGLAGFPASLLDQPDPNVDLRVENGSLRIRSAAIAERYLNPPGATVADSHGFVDTGDLVEQRGDRFHFVGRRDGVINVGGLKVHPEEVEAVINRHPQVRMSVVRTRRNPITGALVVADVVLRSPFAGGSPQAGNLEREILELCRGALARHKVPASIQFVSDLPVAPTGKVLRQPCGTSL